MAGKYTSKKKKEQQKIYSSARDSAYERITGRTWNGQPQKQLSTFEAAQQQAYNNVLSNYDQYKQAIAERQRQQRVLSQYQMNRMQPAGWMNGGPAAQLQAGLNRMQQAKEQAQRQPGFQDWSAASNLLDPNSKVNALIGLRPQEERDYWQGARDQLTAPAQKETRADRLLNTSRVNPRIAALGKNRTMQNPSAYQAAETGQLTKPTDDYQRFVEEMNTIRKYGMYKGQDVRMMSDRQLAQFIAENEAEYNRALENAENRDQLNADVLAHGEKTGKYRVLAAQGLPYYENPKGLLSAIEPEAASGFLNKRPDDYWNGNNREDYDRVLYDFLNGDGAYEQRVEALETDDDVDALENEIGQIWDALENGNIQQMMEDLSREDAEMRQDLYSAPGSKYARNLKLAQTEQAGRERIAELEAGVPEAPEGGWTYDPSLVNTRKINADRMRGIGDHGPMLLWDEVQEGDEVDKIYQAIGNPFNPVGAESFYGNAEDLQKLGTIQPAYYMSPKQKEAFIGYYRSGDKASAKAYYDALLPYLSMYANQHYLSQTDEMSRNEYAPLMVGARVLLPEIAGAYSTLGAVKAILGDEDAQRPESDYYKMSNALDTIQAARGDVWGNWFAEHLGEEWREIGQKANGLGYSIIDNARRQLITKGVSGSLGAEMASKTAKTIDFMLLGSDVMGNTMAQEIANGTNPDEAFVRACGSAAIEVITENMWWDNLFSADVKDMLGTKGAFAKYMFNIFQSEGFEEVSGQVMDTIFDECISALYGHRSELAEKYQQLIDEGMDPTEAGWKVGTDWMKETGWAYLSGGLSALISGGARGVGARFQNNSENVQIGKKALGSGVDAESDAPKIRDAKEVKNLFTIIETGEGFRAGTETKKIADEIRADIRKGKAPDKGRVGALVRSIVNESSETVSSTMKNVLQDAFAQELQTGGMNVDEAQEQAAALADMVTKGEYTKETMMMLAGSEGAQKILAEYRMGGFAEETKKAAELTQQEREAQKSVMDLITTPGERAAEDIRDSVASKMATARYITEKDAEMQEALAAGEQRTGSPLEVVADGKIGNVAGFGLKEIKGKNGTTWAVTAKVETADGTIEVDLNDVLSTNEKTAQILQMVQAENGQSIGEHMGLELLKIAQNTKDIAGAATDAISIAMDDLLGEKTKVTTLSKTEEQAMRAALEEDKKAADAEAAKNQKQLNPGKAKIVLNGVEYGSQKFAQELGKYSAQIRDEANYVAKLMKSIGMDVEFYYDNSEEGSARQGAFVGTQGIRLNLAGTFTSDGVHRSVVATAAHEATHWLRANAQEAYRQLQTYALKGLQNANVNVRNELRRIMDNYAMYGEHLTMDKAAEEMTAMGCEEIFTNEQLVSDLQAEDPTLYGKVKQAVQHVMNLLRKVAGENMATSSRRYAQKLRGTLDQLAKVWKITYEAAKGATENALQKELQASDGTETHYGDNQKFSMRDSVEQRADGLIAVHNLGEDQFIKVMELGGFAMPSIAIIKNDYAHNRYGDISVVFYPSTIDPRASKNNKVYGGDAWTPTYPGIEYKVNAKELNKIYKKVQSLVPDTIKGSQGLIELYDDQFEKSVNSNRGDVLSATNRNLALQVAYMNDRGIKIDYPTRQKSLSSRYSNEQIIRVAEELGEELVREAFEGGYEFFEEHPELNKRIRDMLNDMWREKHKDIALKIANMELYTEDKFGFANVSTIIDGAWRYFENGVKSELDEYALRDYLEEKIDKEDYDNWRRDLFSNVIEKKGIRNNKDLFTNSGNRRNWEALHDEETLENVVNVMRAQSEKGEAAFFHQSSLLAYGTKNFKSIKEIRADKDRLKHISEEEMSAAKTGIINKVSAIQDELSDKRESNEWIARDRALGAIVDAVQTSKTAQGIENVLRQYYGMNVREGMGQELVDIMKEIAELPTEYFEAKPKRAVTFDEIAKVVVPETASQKMLDMMDERGIQYDTYDGTDEDRLRVLNEQENAMFSIRDDTDYDVRQWMETVPEWSLQTEAERQLLGNYKGLRTKMGLDRLRMQKIDEQIRTLEGQIGKVANLEAEEGNPVRVVTVEDALKINGVWQVGKYLTLDGKQIGTLQDGILNITKDIDGIRDKLAGSGAFDVDERTGLLTSKAQNIHADDLKDAQRKLDALRIKKENLQKTMDQTQEKLAEILGNEGFGRMMYQQQKVLDDLQTFGTQKELNEHVARMERAAQEIAKRIEENKAAVDNLAKSDAVKRFRELLGTTTAEKTAAELKKEFSSTWTAKQIRAYLDPIILKMKTGANFQQDVETLAGILVSSDSRNRYEALEDLRGLVITIGKGAQRELKAQNSSLKEVRARLAGTGIQVKYGDRSTLEADIEDLRAEYPMIPELGDEKDALGNFLNWVDSMKSVSAGMEFYDQRIAEAMAVITGKAAGAAKGIYMPNDPKAQQQVLAMMDFVKGMSAETAEAQKALADIAKQMASMQKESTAATGNAKTLMRDVNVALDYYNRISKIAVDEAKQKKQSAVIEQLKSDLAKKILKNNEEWRAQIQRDKDARAQLDENRKMKNRINTCLKRLNNLLKNPKGLQNIPEHMQGLARETISKFIGNDFAGGNKLTTASRDELTEMMRLLNAWEKQSGKFNPADLNAAEDVKTETMLADLDKITDGIRAWNNDIRGKNKLDILKQRGAILQGIQEAVSEIYTAIRAEGEVQAGDRRVSVEDAAYAVAQGTGGKKFREWYGSMGQKMGWLHKAIVSGNMTPEYFFRTLGNQGLSDLWENYHWAENKNGLELKKAQERLAEIAKDHGYKNWDLKEKITLNLQGGDVQITLGQLMSLWATWKREKTLGPQMSEHLTKGGFYAEQDTRDGLLGRKAIEKRAHRVTEEDMEMVREKLTEEQRKFVDDVVGYMSRDMSELGNAASMQAYGIKLYKESYYFPFQMWDGVKSRKSNDAGGAAAANDRAFHPSFSKTRIHGANNAVMIGDFMQVATDHIAGMINYATMGLANENLQKVLNAQTAEGEYDTKRNTRALIEEAYGREAAKYLADLQMQLNGGAVHIDKTFYDKLISLFRKNAVAGSLSVALQQPLSYIRAAMMINPKYLTRAISPDVWKGSYKEMLAHSGVAVIKDMGRFDMNFGQSAKEFLMPDGKEGKFRKVWEGIEEYSTKLPELMDRMTWTRMWSAVKAEQKAQHPEMDVKSDEFLDMVGVRFNDLMRRTQVYDSTLVKSANMRNQNPVIKTLTSFMAEPTLTLNVLADSVRMAKNHEKGGMQMVGKAGATFLLSAVLQAAVKGLMGTGRTPDDKKTWWENFLYRFEYNFLNEADILQLVPGFSDAVTILKGGELKDDAWGALSKMIKAGSGTVDLLLRGPSDKGTYRDIEDTAAQLMQMFTGVPLKNLMRDGRAMWNWTIDRPYATRADSAAVISGQAVDLFHNADNLWGVLNNWLGEAGYSTNNNAYYARIYEAKKAGDDERAQSLIDYLLYGKGIKQESIDSKITGMAKKDENASAADTAEFLIEEGASAETYIRNQMKEKKLTADEARDLLQKADPTKDANSIWWTVDRIQYQLETGAEKVSGNYYRLWDAMDNNKVEEIRTAVKTMTDHGMEPKNIKTQITKQYKDAYLDGTNNEKVKIKDAIEKAYKELGYSTEDADKVINKWKKDKGSSINAGRLAASGSMSDVSTGSRKPKRPQSENGWGQYIEGLNEYWEGYDFDRHDPVGQYGKGTIDLNHRKVVHNPDGSISTELSTTVGFDDGVYLLPTVIDGKIVSEDEAIEYFLKTVRNNKPEYLGKFDNYMDADEYAMMLHNRQDWYYHR